MDIREFIIYSIFSYLFWKFIEVLQAIKYNIEIIKNTSTYMKDEYLDNFKYKG